MKQILNSVIIILVVLNGCGQKTQQDKSGDYHQGYYVHKGGTPYFHKYINRF